MNCAQADKLPTECDAYWTDLIKNKDNVYIPNDFKKFDETQKLMHYTFVF